MAGGSSKSNAPKPRKRVEAESSSGSTTLVRAKDGSAFARCEECNKDVPVVLISMHSCSLDAKIKMNLEAQVVEKQKPTEVKKKSAERKKPTSTEPKPKRLKKIGKDSNKPKRPPTAFFLFMDDFRKEYKAANPDSKSVKEVAIEGGEKWKNMTDEEKKPYLDKAAELKAEYSKALETNNDAENEDEDGVSGKENAADEEDATEGEDAEKVVQEEEEVLDDY